LDRLNWFEMSSTICLKTISTYERNDIEHLISCLHISIFFVVSLVHSAIVELLKWKMRENAEN
jgi:hypothetical protein